MTVPAFPTLIGLAYPVLRSPMFSTIPQKAISGKETRLQLWTYPRYKFEASFDYLGSAAGVNTDWQTLLGFWNSVAGSALPFHWNDPDDNAITAQSLGVGNASQTIFNFIRSLGGFVEPIQDVTPGSVTIYLNGVSQSPSSYTLLTDPNWGLTYAVQFNSAPGAGVAVTATFNYNWPCRFEADEAQFSNFMFRFWELKKLSFQSVKVL